MNIRDKQFLSFARGLVAPAPVDMEPLEHMEAEARASKWRSAERGSLYVLCRPDGSFSYQFGNAEISRREAALRVVGRAS
jgi:hypothetical protein